MCIFSGIKHLYRPLNQIFMKTLRLLCAILLMGCISTIITAQIRFKTEVIYCDTVYKPLKNNPEIHNTLQYRFEYLTSFPNVVVKNKINNQIWKIESGIQSSSNMLTFQIINKIIGEEIKDYQSIIDDTAPEDLTPSYFYQYSLKSTSSLESGLKGIVLYKNLSLRYMGGATIIMYATRYNFSPKTGNLITLEQVFSPQVHKEVLKSVISNFIFEGILHNGAQPDVKLSPKFLLLKDGIEFQYDPYDIGPGALGAPTTTIDYSSIKQYINRNTEIGRFIYDNIK